MNAPKHELDKRKERAAQVKAKLDGLRAAEGPMKAATKAKLAEAVDKAFPHLEGVCMASETYMAGITIRITVDFTPGSMAVKVVPKVVGARKNAAVSNAMNGSNAQTGTSNRVAL